MAFKVDCLSSVEYSHDKGITILAGYYYRDYRNIVISSPTYNGLGQGKSYLWVLRDHSNMFVHPNKGPVSPGMTRHHG